MDKLATYRASASDGFNVETSAAVAASIAGSATREIWVTRFSVSAFHADTTLQVMSITCKKWSTAPTGGATIALTATPLDSGFPAATATAVGWDDPPTDGTLVGVVGIKRLMVKVDTAVVDGASFSTVTFDFRRRPVVLHGAAEVLGVAFGSLPTQRISITPYIEWIEL